MRNAGAEDKESKETHGESELELEEPCDSAPPLSLIKRHKSKKEQKEKDRRGKKERSRA